MAVLLAQIKILNLLYLFLSFVVLTPVFEIAALGWRRRRVRRRLAAARGACIVTLIHTMETMSLMGFPVARYIRLPSTDELVAALRVAPDGASVDLIVHLPRGIDLDWRAIAETIRARGDVTVMVPQYALSGGGALARAAAHLIVAESALVAPLPPAGAGSAGGSPPTAAEASSASDGRPIAGALETSAPEAAGEAGGPAALAALGMTVSTAIPEAVDELLRLYPQPPRRRARYVFFGMLPRQRGNR